MNLNKEQKVEIAAWTGFMLQDAEKLLRSYRVIAAIDQRSAGIAINEVIEKLQKPGMKRALLEDLEDNWNKGMIEKEYYEKTLAYINKQYS